jgi:hypothetical protein
MGKEIVSPKPLANEQHLGITYQLPEGSVTMYYNNPPKEKQKKQALFWNAWAEYNQNMRRSQKK